MGGVLPALLWLWFWLKEDKARPEPRGLLMLAFVAGMVTIPFVIPLQQVAIGFTGGVVTTTTIVLWAGVEEVLKYFAATLVVLKRKAVDEPLDPIIYMITIALGFSALENTLFLLNPNLGLFDGIITGNLRFLGATLLHILASATVGVAMALSFFKPEPARKAAVRVGLLLAIILHSLFNFFIIESNGEKILTVFSVVWIGVIVLLLVFEKIKRIKLNALLD